ncbi:MAG: hypothetical protein R3F40_15180 [Candidatus Competibacteraceae bacterium]
MIGQSARLLYPSTAEFEAVGKDLYQQIRKNSVGTMETRWRRKDGTVFPVLLSASSLHPANPDDGTTFTALDLSSQNRKPLGLRPARRVIGNWRTAWRKGWCTKMSTG